jgi:hypothetical protein
LDRQAYRALTSCDQAELCLFTISGAVVYSYTGTILTTAPAYGSLIAKYGRPAAAFTLPTIIIVGILYSLVTSRAVFFQIFPENSIHRRTHTVKGWTVWTAIVTIGWLLAFVIGESIPFFNECVRLGRLQRLSPLPSKPSELTNRRHVHQHAVLDLLVVRQLVRVRLRDAQLPLPPLL